MDKPYTVALTGKELSLLDYLLKTTKNLLGSKFGTETEIDLRSEIDTVLNRVSEIMPPIEHGNQLTLLTSDRALIHACADAFIDLINEMQEALETGLDEIATPARKVIESQTDLITEIQCLVIHLTLAQVSMDQDLFEIFSNNNRN